MLSTQSRVYVSVCVGVCLLCAMAVSQAGATTTLGGNFDGNMSVIYDDSSGNLFLENAPLPNPAVQRLRIASAGGNLIPGNLNIPALIPAVTVTSATTGLIDVEWSGGDFLGTGSFIGNILATGHTQPALLADLTIDWAPSTSSLTAGDLIHGTYGTTAGNPVLPGASTDGFFRFFDVASGQFFDPPMAQGFTYDMTGGAKFTKLGLPLGYGSSFDVVVSSVTVASGLIGGDQYIFGGGGVSSFTLLGIDPAVDAANSDAFPLYLEFDQATASFNMTAVEVPEPATLSLLTIAGLAMIRRRR